MTIKIAPVRKSITVKATQARAFEVFTAGMSQWWPGATHTTLKSPFKDAIIEPFAGGRWYHVGIDGSQAETGKVLAWEPPGRLLLAWQLDHNWTYRPELLTEIEVKFIAEGTGTTRVELEHRLLERAGEKEGDIIRTAIDAPGGWGGLLAAYAAYTSQSQ